MELGTELSLPRNLGSGSPRGPSPQHTERCKACACTMLLLCSPTLKHHLTAGNKRDIFVQESTITLFAHLPTAERKGRALGSPPLTCAYAEILRTGNKIKNCIWLKGGIFMLVCA